MMSESQSLNERRDQAEENFQKALSNLSDTSSIQLKKMVKNVEGEVNQSIQNISEAAVLGLREIKDELSISAAVRRNPKEWMLGAAIFGGTFVALLQLNSNGVEILEHSGAISLRGVNRSRGSKVGSKINWSRFLVDVGLTVLQAQMAKRSKQTNTVPYGSI